MKRISLIISIAVLLFSCRKEKKNETNCPQPVAQPQTLYHGYFALAGGCSNSSVGSPMSLRYINPSVRFSATGFYNTGAIGLSSFVDSVKLNGFKFSKIIGDTAYNRMTFTSDSLSPPRNWQLYWNSYLPYSAYTDLDSLPECKGYLNLPDSIDRSQNFNLIVNGISNCDPSANPLNAVIFITDQNSNGNTITKCLNLGNNSYLLTPVDLSILNSTNQAYLTMSLSRQKSVNINGKDFLFLYTQSYNKIIKIK